MDEVWVAAYCSKDYLVSTYGNIKSLARIVKTGRRYTCYRELPEMILKPIYKRGNGYYAVKIASKQYSIHSVVLSSFKGPRPIGMCGCHNDGNKANNALSNLRWDTPKANASDKLLHGTHRFGETMPNAKFSDADIKAIRNDKRPRCHIAKDYGVTPEAISHIVLRKTWKHVV